MPIFGKLCFKSALIAVLCFISLHISGYTQPAAQFSQFTFVNENFIVEYVPGPGGLMKFVVINQLAQRDSFITAGMNITSFQAAFRSSVKRLCVKMDIPLSPNDEGRLTEVSGELFMTLYARFSVDDEDVPVAGSMYVRPMAQTINYEAYKNYKQRKEKSTSKLQWFKSKSQNHNRTRHSKLDAYLRMENPKQQGVTGYFAVDSVTIEIFESTIRNMEVRGSLYLLNRKKFGLDGQDTITILDRHKLRINSDTVITLSVANNSYIENYGGEGALVKTPAVYRNQYPIPIASLDDISDMGRIFLIDMFEKRVRWRLPLALVLRYVPQISFNSDDYSPANGIYTVHPDRNGQGGRMKIFYREKTTNLFNARIYGDFIGLKAGEPNGLIQTEISKKIILFPQKYYLNAFNYVEPRLVFSKIDNKQKFLRSFEQVEQDTFYVTETVQDTFISYDTTLSYTKKINTGILDILKYAALSIGARTNVFKLDFPDQKLGINFNAGLYLFQTAFRDTLRETNALTGNTTISTQNFSGLSLAIETEVELKLRPDTRYGLGLLARQTYFKPLTPAIQYTKGFIYSFHLIGHFKPSMERHNTIYFRAGAFFLGDDWGQNFLQMQVGYSMSIVGRI